MSNLLFMVLLLVVIVRKNAGQMYYSPCPTTFSFMGSSSVGQIGVYSHNRDELNLTVLFTVQTQYLDRFQGSIKLMDDQMTAADKLRNGMAIMYQVNFPPTRTPAKIRKILVNDEEVCLGTGHNPKDGPLTLIRLQHKLSNVVVRHPSTKVPIKVFSTVPTSTNDLFINTFTSPIDLATNPFINGEITFEPTSSTNFQITSTRRQVPTKPPRRVAPTAPTSIFRPQSCQSSICGYTQLVDDLIIGGQSVDEQNYPWLVALHLITKEGPKYICCGVLVDTRHVITAAHCVVKQENEPQQILVTLGSLNLDRIWDSASDANKMRAKRIHVHPTYTKSQLYDLAVIVLPECVKINSGIVPICLWDGDSDLSAIEGTRGTVVGWGKDKFGVVQTSKPMQVEMPVVSQEMCWASDRRFTELTNDQTFCAGEKNGEGPCNGDSGSGFIIKKGDRWMLRGIVAKALYVAGDYTNCDLRNYIIFTDVAKYGSWLRSVFDRRD